MFRVRKAREIAGQGEVKSTDVGVRFPDLIIMTQDNQLILKLRQTTNHILV